MGQIKDSEYEILRSKDPTLRKHFTGTWWTSRLIRLIIYFSLNECQTRNDTLHNDRIQSEQREEQRKLLKKQRLELCTEPTEKPKVNHYVDIITDRTWK